jgi:hypothetical protein
LLYIEDLESLFFTKTKRVISSNMSDNPNEKSILIRLDSNSVSVDSEDIFKFSFNSSDVLHRASRIVLKSFNFFNVQENVCVNTNQLKYSVNGISYTAFVEPAQYSTTDSLVLAIQYSLDQVFVGITVTADSKKQKLIFTNNTGSTLVLFADCSAAQIIGLHKDTTILNTDAQILQYLDMIGLNEVLIVSETLAKNNGVILRDKESGEISLLTNIMVNNGFGSKINFETLHWRSNMIIYRRPRDIRLIDLQFIDERTNKPVLFYGTAWSITLQIFYLP